VVAKTEKPLGFTETVGVPRDAVAGFRRALQDKGGRPRRVPEGRLRPALVEVPETLGEQRDGTGISVPFTTDRHVGMSRARLTIRARFQ
jgi:hypothetical protein